MLQSSYAITQEDKRYEKLELGEGIVGQVALQKKAIHLRNIKKSEDYISTGIMDEAPLSSYTLPLLYENELYGVISLSSFELFPPHKIEALNICADILAASLYSAFQTQKIQELLHISEEAREEARQSADELKGANMVLLQQQELLQQQAEELQQTNTELEEQQQLLQQQSEELQQTNVQLEEQQQQLEEQATILNLQNKQLEEAGNELKKRTEALEASNKYKSEFLANMSHELRTPLNSIILLSRLLMSKSKSKISDQDKEKISIISNAGQDLLRLIDDILDLSKIEAGRMTIEKSQTHTGSLIKEIQQLFEGLAKEKNLMISFEDRINTRIYGDIHKISQILRNLISNAIKFTESGSVSVVMEPDPASPSSVLFTVKDTGIGIAPEKREVIFEAFLQSDGSISRKYGGTGLGLSISKKLAELLGGYIHVNSQVGKGSEFTLQIPDLTISSAADGGITKAYSIAEEEAAASVLETEAVNPDKVVLVIEDDMTFSTYLKEIIKGMGFIPLIASDGKEGLRFAMQYRPHGILLDLNLPDMSGIDVLRELKRTVELREIPVHILSVDQNDTSPQRMGAIGFEQKPLEESEIVKLIAQMIDFSEKSPKQCLIIEDNPAQQIAIKDLLGSSNVSITSVDTQKEAENEIIKACYDVILLDLGLKEGNGFDVLKFIRNRSMETPVIVYTGRELTAEDERQIQKYADSIIIKTAYSQERLLDEATLFLHNVRKNKRDQYYLNLKTNEQISLDLNGKRIMIVDDDPRNVYALASALEQYGAEIIEAENGRLALQKLQQYQTDLILMDVMMPEMDGFEAMRAIRTLEKVKSIPIIALTAKTMPGDKEKCLEAGANDYISKPVDYDTLVRLVKAWILKK